MRYIAKQFSPPRRRYYGVWDRLDRTWVTVIPIFPKYDPPPLEFAGVPAFTSRADAVRAAELLEQTLDFASSASRQHYIDTGYFLAHGEAI